MFARVLRTHLLLAVGGAILIGFPLTHAVGQENIAPLRKPLTKEEVQRKAAELRARYPFVSLAKRLAYEDRLALKDAPPGELGEEARQHLEALEVAGSHRFLHTRTRSLELLHSDQVEKFISSDGFGVSRMPQPAPQMLELAAAEAVRYPRYLLESTDAKSESPRAVPLPAEGEANPFELPSRKTLFDYHLGGQLDFASTYAFGYVRNRDHVAGFVPHQFRSLPRLVTRWEKDLSEPSEAQSAAQAPPSVGPGSQKAAEEWELRRLELVSLLKHEKPAVYVSATLPKMDDLATAETRSLNEFEGESLAALRAGESLVARSTANHLEMVGALRAGKQCLACHSVRRGELLGAFSYELHRRPEWKPAKSGAAASGG